MRYLLVISVLAAGCMVGDPPLDVSADEPLPTDLRAGDVIHIGEIAVEVPLPGETVQLVAEGADGSQFQITISNPLDGVVSVVKDDPQIEPIVIASGSPAPCQDGAFHLAGHKWKTEYQWRFDARTTPAANSAANVEIALERAATAITSSRNDCGLADQVSATNRYLGRTTAAPNIAGAGTTVTCGSRDSISSVGFGALPTAFLGVACTWTDGTGAALEGDVKLSTRHAWFALDVPSACSNRFGVQAVATHEFGHVFGLAHVSESAHPNLTMSTAAAPCSNAPYSLGLGDVRALRQLY